MQEGGSSDRPSMHLDTMDVDVTYGRQTPYMKAATGLAAALDGGRFGHGSTMPGRWVSAKRVSCGRPFHRTSINLQSEICLLPKKTSVNQLLSAHQQSTWSSIGTLKEETNKQSSYCESTLHVDTKSAKDNDMLQSHETSVQSPRPTNVLTRNLLGAMLWSHGLWGINRKGLRRPFSP